MPTASAFGVSFFMVSLTTRIRASAEKRGAATREIQSVGHDGDAGVGDRAGGLADRRTRARLLRKAGLDSSRLG